MAYINIPSTDIEVGDVITSDLVSKIKNNLDDLNTRLNALAAQPSGGGGLKIAENLILTVNAPTNNVAYHVRTIPSGRVAKLTIPPGVFISGTNSSGDSYYTKIHFNGISYEWPEGGTIDIPGGTNVSCSRNRSENSSIVFYITEYTN
ncbi:MAG: hypothetical protein PHY47_00210 [Lachnospiraceae bacterium]|nr:hypothetical protein [Lachnospiraceae bacterium]